jgi:hypothetical protein
MCDEDAFHKASEAYERWVLCFDTSTEHVQTLWDAREKLVNLLHQHWAAIKLDATPKITQLTQPTAATGEELRAMLSDALGCGVFILYAGTRVVMLLNHSVVSGHLGCKLTSWASSQDWADHIGMPPPSLLTELMCTTIFTWRIWRVPIVRSYWRGDLEAKKPLSLPARQPVPLSLPAGSARAMQYAGHFNVADGTHPQAVMHQVLTRVTDGWRVAGQPAAWTVCSAAPFKEIAGVANNVGVMSYTFPIEPASSARHLRDELTYSKWQVVLSAAANRTFAGGAGAGFIGSIMSRVAPDMHVGRCLVDAVFSFMVMDLGHAQAVHLYSTNNAFTASRQKAFIAAAYDKKTGRVHVTLSVNPNADEMPDEARLRGAGFEPFEPFGPFDPSRLKAAIRAELI